MKLVIRTKRHFGDNKIHLQGVQFEAYFIHNVTDGAEEFKAMHELSNIVMADCREAGWIYAFGKWPDDQKKNNGGRESQCEATPYTDRERVLKARAASAENLARQYKRQIDEMRLVMVRAGLAVKPENGKKKPGQE